MKRIDNVFTISISSSKKFPDEHFLFFYHNPLIYLLNSFFYAECLCSFLELDLFKDHVYIS